LAVQIIRRLASIDEELFGLNIHKYIGNEEPRGVSKILGGFGLGGNAIHTSALCADPIFGGISDSKFWRCLLDEVRNYFASNPNECD
jgi:hypothetical protein